MIMQIWFVWSNRETFPCFKSTDDFKDKIGVIQNWNAFKVLIL